MNNVGLFVDTSDLYHKVQRKFGQGNKVCYEAYYDCCRVPCIVGVPDDQPPDSDITHAIAYGMQNENRSFTNCLKNTGFTTRFKPPRIFNVGDRKIKKCDWNIAITLDIVSLVEELDTVVLGSSNNLFFPLVKWLQARDIRVEIFASCIPRNLRDAADEAIEIDSDCLEVKEEA